MELLRRFFWSVELVVLTVAAWLLATSLNEILSDRLFGPTPRPRSVAAGAPPSRGAPLASVLPRSHPERAYAAALDARRVFNADPLPEPAPPAPEPEPEPEPEPDEDGPLEETDLDLELIGTVVASDDSLSIATVRLENDSQLAREGMALTKGEGEDGEVVATVLEIHRRHMVIREDGERRYVPLWDHDADGRDRKPRVRRRGRRKRPKVTRRPGRPRTDYRKGVRKVAMYEYEVDRAMLDEELENLSEIGRQARIVPNYRNGQYQGFRLIGVRPRSLYRALGLRSGDVVKRVNGRELNSPNKAVELLEALKREPEIALDIERRGHKRTLEYDIE